MLIKFDEEKSNFYYCTCSDWSAIVIAENEREAAKESLINVISELSEEANVSAAIRVKKINENVENTDSFFRMDETLSDIGMYKESKALREIFNNDRN